MKNKAMLCRMSAVFLVVLLAVILFQAHTISSLRRPEQSGVVGTYTTFNGPGGGGEYIVLEQDGICASYTQFGAVARGTYQEGENIISMRFPDRTVDAVYADGQLYLFSPEGSSVFRLEKVSDTPTYINVEA